MSSLVTFALAAAGVASALTWLIAGRRPTRIAAMLIACGIAGYFLNQLGELFPRGG